VITITTPQQAIAETLVEGTIWPLSSWW